MEWLDPWYSTAGQGEDLHDALAAQLRLEIGQNDPLDGIPVRLIGRGNGDDAVFELLDGTGRVAYVHLQWGKLPDGIDEFRTRSRVYQSLEAFAAECMVPDHHEWVGDAEDE